MVLNKQDTIQFIKNFHEKYNKESVLGEIAEVISFEEKYNHLQYFKIGRRTGLPTTVINDSTDPVMIINSFVRRLRTGERNYVLRDLDRLAEEDDINSTPINDISKESLDEWCSKVDNPNHLFLPMDSEYFREGTKLGADIPEDRLKIDWIPLDQNIKNGFLLNSSNVDIVRKSFNHTPEPSEFDHNSKFDQFSRNRQISLYFGEDVFIDEEQDEKYQKQVDFLYFAMLSQVLTSYNDAVRLVPQKNLSSE